MEEAGFQRKPCTWANNWDDENYIEVRLHRFFGSSYCLMENSKAVVKHIECQASDHSLLVLDTTQEQPRRKTRFYFDKLWVKKLGVDDLIS